MPSREEIVGWLREVEQEYKQLASDIKHPFNRVALKAQIKWGKRAKQVENMRCETCERYVSGEDDEACTFNQIEYQGPGFGCFFHKPKEITDER